MPKYKDTLQNRKLKRVGEYYTRKNTPEKKSKYIKRTTYADTPKNRALNRVGMVYDSFTDIRVITILVNVIFSLKKCNN